MRTCDVVMDGDCHIATRCTCFACGMPACRNCSAVVPYLGYGKRRICRNCMEAHEMTDLAEILGRRGGEWEGWNA